MDIVDEIKADSEAGTLRLEREYKERLLAVASRFCHDRQEAEALVYQTMCEAVRCIDTLAEPAAFFGWMCGIMSNLYGKQNRRKIDEKITYTDQSIEIADECAGADSVMNAVDATLLREAIESLPPKLKEAVLLRYFADMSITQIAKFLTIPVGTVNSRLHLARAALAKRLGTKLKKPAVGLTAAALLLIASAAAIWSNVDLSPADPESYRGGDAPVHESAKAAPALGFAFENSISSSETTKETATMNTRFYGELMTSTLLTLGSTLGSATACAEPIGRGLAAYCTFDGSVPSNRVQNSLVTGITLSDGGIGSGAVRGGSGSSCLGGCLDINQGWARLDGSQNLEFDNGNDFTICIWMRMDGGQTGDPVFVGNGSWSATATPGVLLSAAPSDSTWVSALNYSVAGTSRVRQNSSSLQLGAWTFFAITHTSDGKFGYYMGGGSGALTAIIENDAPNFKMVYDDPSSRRPFYLGQDGTGAYSKPFVGKLDEFALWTRGLGFSDINAIYQNGLKGRPLDELLKPGLEVADAGSGTVNISFDGVRSGSYELYVASGGADGGTDRFAWDHFDRVTTVSPTDEEYLFALPESFKNEGRYYRFFLTKAPACQEIEYLENTGTYGSDSAYVTTSIFPTKDTSVCGEVEFEALGDGTWRNIFGCADTRYFQFGVHNSSEPYDWYTEIRKLESGGNTFMGTVAPGTRYAFEYCAASMTVWNASHRNETVSAQLLSSGTVFADMTAPITVFRCTRSTGAIYDRPFTGKMYGFSIFTNGVLACDFVPAKNASGKAGLYDTVAKSFLPSEGADFAGGSAECGRLTSQSATMKAMTASDPVTACWIGGSNGAIDDPASWRCVNSYGAVISAVPQMVTDISVANAAQMFDVPANSGFACNSIVIGAPISLSGDCDWSGIDISKVPAGSFDLAGHKFHISASSGFGGGVSFTDTVGGGELRVSVPANRTVDNSQLPLSGALAFVKDGEGTLLASRQNQTFTGGVSVVGGMLKTTAFMSTRVLGPSGSKVVVGNCATLRIEDGYTGLENYNLELAGGTLYMYNGKLLEGRTVIGSLVQTADSTICVQSEIANDNLCDVELAEGTVWNLGGCELTVRMMSAESDFFVGRAKTVKPVFRNGTISLPSKIGYWQDYGSDASDHVCYNYAMKYPRQIADSSAYDFVNSIPSEGSNFSNDGVMSIYGTYTPLSDVCSKLRMMNGSTIDLSGRSGAWPMLGGSRPMTFEANATVNIDFGSRKISQDEKVISWNSAPSGVRFVNTAQKWGLVMASDGLYANRGLMLILR